MVAVEWCEIMAPWRERIEKAAVAVAVNDPVSSVQNNLYFLFGFVDALTYVRTYRLGGASAGIYLLCGR